MKNSELKIKINWIVWIAIAILAVKCVLILSYGDFSNMNGDEERNYAIASNYLQGEGYTIDGKLTAWHGSFTVMLYKWIIEHKIAKESYIAFVHLISILVFTASIPFFYRIIVTSGVSERASLIATLIYCVYPSNLLYIGNLFLYEKLTLPLFIIAFYLLFNVVRNRKSSNYAYLVPVIVLVSCLLRPQMILIYFTTFALFLVYAFNNRSKVDSFKKFTFISILTACVLVFSHIPLLQKNHTMFGSYIISTQVGFELMQGHNDMARGSWLADWKDGPYSDYSKNVIPNVDQLNEYEESTARKEYAIDWIKQNPLKELELIARKIAIFMLPKTYLSGYNFVNIIIHSLFLISILLALINKKMDSTTLLFLAPILGTLLLSLIFFVGFRVRYFAEPFFIIVVFYQLSRYIYVKKQSF
jgi:hypothetical protein